MPTSLTLVTGERLRDVAVGGASTAILGDISKAVHVPEPADRTNSFDSSVQTSDDSRFYLSRKKKTHNHASEAGRRLMSRCSCLDEVEWNMFRCTQNGAQKHPRPQMKDVKSTRSLLHKIAERVAISAVSSKALVGSRILPHRCLTAGDVMLWNANNLKFGTSPLSKEAKIHRRKTAYDTTFVSYRCKELQ
nr:hypothetical protein CFP56_57955 [Quercus suber]